MALALGESLPMIARLLGHSQIQTTARYAHLARQSVKTAADRVADSLADDMDVSPCVPSTTCRRQGLLSSVRRWVRKLNAWSTKPEMLERRR